MGGNNTKKGIEKSFGRLKNRLATRYSGATVKASALHILTGKRSNFRGKRIEEIRKQVCLRPYMLRGYILVDQSFIRQVLG
jgi:hypothetical protein